MPVLAALPLLLYAGIPWTQDYGQAFAQAERQGRPVLVFFRADCGGGNRPQNPIEVGGPITHQEGLSECDLMQHDVWEAAEVAKTAERFLPVVVEGGDRTLQVRYQAVRMPTTVITDPWGNEIFRSSGYVPRDKVARILEAVPADFAALAPAGRALKMDPANWSALVAAAAFYEGARLPQVSERLYGKALSGSRAEDVAAWRQAVIARGVNLMVRLQGSAAAAEIFEKELAAAPRGPASDALLLGIVNARLQDGRRKEAEAAYQKMVRDFAESPFTARAKQNLEASKK
jgi:hypothetical protein